MKEIMDRRCFIKKSAVTGLAVGISLFTGSPEIVFSDENKNEHPDLVAVKNGEPDAMFDKGIALMGGMNRFVKKGQTVLVKPNIGFNKSPEFGANTNPKLVKSIVEHCFGAGAKKVYVFDHEAYSSYGLAAKCYKNSGIQDAASSAGAIVAPGDDEKYYQEVKISKASVLHTAKVHELVLETDVLISVPILKSHHYTFLTSAMKNMMGVVWDRMAYHFKGLDQCIADFCLFKKPTLNVVDAYRVMKTNGPQGYSLEDVVIAKSLLISDDIVAIDTAASKILGIEPEKVEYIGIGRDLKLGNMNLNELSIKRIML